MTSGGVPREEFDNVVSRLIEKWFYLQANLMTMQTALTEAGILSAAELDRAREQAFRELKATVESQKESLAEKLSKTLREFEGPPQ